MNSYSCPDTPNVPIANSNKDLKKEVVVSGEDNVETVKVFSLKEILSITLPIIEKEKLSRSESCL